MERENSDYVQETKGEPNSTTRKERTTEEILDEIADIINEGLAAGRAVPLSSSRVFLSSSVPSW
jgi:hypothetical protein